LHRLSRYFTPAPKEQGHGAAQRDQAVRLYLEGMSLRAIGRLLGGVHQSVANWVAEAAGLPATVSDPSPTRGRRWTSWTPSSSGRRDGIRRDRGGAAEPPDRRGVGDGGLRRAGDAGDGEYPARSIALLHGWGGCRAAVRPGIRRWAESGPTTASVSSGTSPSAMSAHISS
jgi:hypothetical protein